MDDADRASPDGRETTGQRHRPERRRTIARTPERGPLTPTPDPAADGVHRARLMRRDRATVSEPLLRIRDLKVEFATDDGIVTAVDNVSLEVETGGVLGLVGESGCGKSV